MAAQQPPDSIPPSVSAYLRPPKPFYNWARTYKCIPSGIFHPTSEGAVQEIVSYCASTNTRLRVVGYGHSPSDLSLIDSDGYLMTLEHLSGIIDVDQESKVVNVRAGTWLRDFHDQARHHGLALSCLGSISEQSIAGAIATATHGSDPSKLVTVDASSDPDLFNAAICSLGTIGVIVSLKIECEYDFKLEEEAFTMPMSAFINNLVTDNEKTSKSGLAYSAPFVRAFWFPQVNQIKVNRLYKTTKPVTPAPSAIISYLKGEIIGKRLHEFFLFLGRYIPNLLQWHASAFYHFLVKPRVSFRSTPSTPPSSSTDPSFPRSSSTVHRVGLSNNIFNYSCLFSQHTYEGAVPIERTQECLSELDKWLQDEYSKRNGMRHHFPLEVRFAAADEVWLSPCYHRTMCYIGLVQYRPYGFPVLYQKLFERFQNILLAHEGKPHWAKAHGLLLNDLRKLYPRLDDFNLVREKVDPNGIFMNPYTERCLVGRTDEQFDPTQFETERILE